MRRPPLDDVLRTVRQISMTHESHEHGGCAEPRAATDRVPLPLVNLLQRPAHQLRLIPSRQPRSIPKRCHPLLVRQHPARPRPVRSPHATVEPERIDDPQHRIPDIVIRKPNSRQRTSPADLNPNIGISRQRQQARQIRPGLGQQAAADWVATARDGQSQSPYPDFAAPARSHDPTAPSRGNSPATRAAPPPRTPGSPADRPDRLANIIAAA